MMTKHNLKRYFLANRIDALLNSDISIHAFGREMIAYWAFEDKYTLALEPGYKDLLKEIFSEFMDMHDVDQGDFRD